MPVYLYGSGGHDGVARAVVTVRSSVLTSSDAVRAYDADQEAVMYNAFRNSKRNRDRDTNAELTREQLGVQEAKLRENIRHWYRRLTRRKSAERKQLRAITQLTTTRSAGAPPYSGEVQQPIRATAVLGKHPHAYCPAPSDHEQGRACSSNRGARPCQQRARTGREPGALSCSQTMSKPALTRETAA
jgi:hypothetical protein